MTSHKILIVDDEEDIILNLRSIISRNLDCTIKTAKSFHEAKTILASYQPTLAFIDVNLGDGNGFDILNSLTKSKQQIAKIIMMSAYATENEIANARTNGAFTFMQKPFTKEFVMNCLQESTH